MTITREQYREIQIVRLYEARGRCMEKLEQESQEEGDDVCPGVWDDIMCWGNTPSGTTVTQPCPEYILNFNHSGFAVKECLSNSTWYHKPLSNHPFTNYSECQFIGTQIDLTSHASGIRLMYQIGYGVSLTTLSIAVLIMLFCRGLHSKINKLHTNLFISLTLKAILTLVKECLFVDGVGLDMDVTFSTQGKLVFREGGTHWQCKLLVTVWMYSIGSVYTWILVEGVYLTNLVHRTLSTDRSGVKYYIIFGWTFPLVYVTPWAFVRIFLDDLHCWLTYRRRAFYWIFNGPIFASVIVTFILFLVIIRALCSRMAVAERHVNQKYRKLAKFTLVLMIAFGVHFTVFVFIPDDLLVPILYAYMFSNAFQGFFVSLFFCFLNEEVLHAIKRGWNRFMARRRSRRQMSETYKLHSQRSEQKHILPDKGDGGGQVYSTDNADSTCRSPTAFWRRSKATNETDVGSSKETPEIKPRKKCVFVDKRQQQGANSEALGFARDRACIRPMDSASPESGEQSSRRSSFDRTIDSGVHSS